MCVLKCCDLAKKGFINHLFCPHCILSIVFFFYQTVRKKHLDQNFQAWTTFSKNWSGGPKFSMKKLVLDQNFQQTKVSMTAPLVFFVTSRRQITESLREIRSSSAVPTVSYNDKHKTWSIVSSLRYTVYILPSYNATLDASVITITSIAT